MNGLNWLSHRDIPKGNAQGSSMLQRCTCCVTSPAISPRSQLSSLPCDLKSRSPKHCHPKTPTENPIHQNHQVTMQQRLSHPSFRRAGSGALQLSLVPWVPNRFEDGDRTFCRGVQDQIKNDGMTHVKHPGFPRFLTIGEKFGLQNITTLAGYPFSIKLSRIFAYMQLVVDSDSGKSCLRSMHHAQQPMPPISYCKGTLTCQVMKRWNGLGNTYGTSSRSDRPGNSWTPKSDQPVTLAYR